MRVVLDKTQLHLKFWARVITGFLKKGSDLQKEKSDLHEEKSDLQKE